MRINATADHHSQTFPVKSTWDILALAVSPWWGEGENCYQHCQAQLGPVTCVSAVFLLVSLVA